MKNILLIGDSILVGSNQTSGYGTIVRDMLKDKANTSTALLCRYGMTLDLLFESVNGNIIIRMRNRP